MVRSHARRVDTGLAQTSIGAALSLSGVAAVIAAGALSSAVGCGGGQDFGPQPLVPDPAVETGCQAAPVAAGQSRAKLVACTEELPAGLLVSGRVGDVVLENDRIEVVVRGFGDGFYLMGTGPGGIVDAARLGADDAIKEIVSVFDFNGVRADEIVITEAGDDGPATVVIRGPAQVIPFVDAALSTAPVAAIVEQRYILEPDTDALAIRTFVFGVDGQPAADNQVTVGEALFFGGAIQTFIPERGVIEGAASGQIIASAGRDTSYGLVYAPDSAADIEFVDVANVKLGFGPDQVLDAREPVERWLIVGDGSVSSVTDRAWALVGEDTGAVSGQTAPGVDVSVSDAAGRPITVARADDAGRYAAALPPGAYTAIAVSETRTPGTEASVIITAGGDATLDLAAGASGTIAVTARDTDGTPLPSRVVLFDEAGERRIDYTGADGALNLAVPPGTYALLVSRGMEYDAFSIDPLVVEADATVAADATLERVVDTSGWIAVDTHLHSEMSTDSQIALPDRLLAAAAEGLDVAISTDHDFVTDYAPVVASLGLSAWLATAVGVETSTLLLGHINTWPLAPDYDRPAGDAIAWYGLSPGEIFALMRERGGGVVIQVNHPYHPDSGMFDIIDLDPATLTARRDPASLGLPGADLSDLSFDAIEVANDLNKDELEQSFAAWLQMTAAGHPAVATGSSDSHGATRFAGNSRTYVFVGAGADDPATLDMDAAWAALVAGRAVVAQGAFVTASVIDPATGEVTPPDAIVDVSGQAEARLRVTVQAPPWLSLTQIRIFAGPDVAVAIPLDPADTQPVRFDEEVAVPLLGGDGFFVARVDPADTGNAVLGNPVASFTNALRFDGDGDGAWTP